MRKINTTIHDNFIRAILADKNVAVSYFQNFLPREIVEQLDFSTLTQIPDTYLSENLQKSMSDVVYSCNLKGDERNIRIALLIEHKSYPDKFTPIQMGSYIFSGYEKQLKSNEELSVIVPLLLYHGKGKWEYKQLSGLFPHSITDWKQYIPDFDYIYNNLGEISDEDVESLQNKFLTASLLALKHSFQKNWLEENAVRILILSENVSENLQRNLAVYLFAKSNLHENEILEIIESLPLKLKHTVMSTLDIFEAKGVKRGIEEGIEKGIEMGVTNVTKNLILNTDFSASKIAMLTGISEEQVSKIKAEIAQ